MVTAADIAREAAAFARDAHAGQERLSGHPYFDHAAATAEIVAALGLDDVTVAAAYLHDVLEETDVPAAELERRFGEDVRGLVEAVTNLQRLDFASEAEYKRANLMKMLLAMAGDVRVVMIKIADRLDNLRSLEHLPPGRRRRFARETLYVFAPLADRLGLGHIRWELEDLSFRHLEAARYRKLAEMVAARRAARDARVAEVVRELREALAREGLAAEVTGRAKNLYSVHRKMAADGKSFDDVYDLLGVRVVTGGVADCYRVLDVVHGRYERLPGRYKDYVARPKANLYQSIHTSVRLPGGDAVEIQIRTREMDAVAEYGVAAHWRYKRPGGCRDWGDLPALAVMRSALGTMGRAPGQGRLEALFADLSKGDVFVFTPRGDVKRLPRGATPVDFAYAVHTAVGHRCVGARVNGRLAPLRTALESGDVVEVQTGANSVPSRDWLDFVASSAARNKIRAFFRRKDRDELAALGRQLITRAAEKRGIKPADVLAGDVLAELARSRGVPSAEGLLARVGDGALSAEAVVSAAAPAPVEPPPLPAAGLPDYRAFVAVSGMRRVEVKMARCCNPIPVAPIVGYVTSRGAVSIHRADCRTVRRLGSAARLLEANWQLEDDVTGVGYLDVTVEGGEAAMPELVRRVRRTGLRVAGLDAEDLSPGKSKCTLHVRLATPARLKRAAKELRGLDFVSVVEHRLCRP
jgi:GTP pyrophosphokinase